MFFDSVKGYDFIYGIYFTMVYLGFNFQLCNFDFFVVFVHQVLNEDLFLGYEFSKLYTLSYVLKKKFTSNFLKF